MEKKSQTKLIHSINPWRELVQNLSHMPPISRHRKFKMLSQSWNLILFLYQHGNFWNVIFGWFVNCSKRESATTLSKLSVRIRGAHQLLQTQRHFYSHKGMRYNSPTPASPEYFLVVLIYCRTKWKVRGSPGAGHVGWVSAVMQQRHRAENTPAAGKNWKPHKKTQQLFLHLPTKQELRARQSLGPPRKRFLSLSKGHFIFPHKIGLIYGPVNFSKEKNLLNLNIYY